MGPALSHGIDGSKTNCGLQITDCVVLAWVDTRDNNEEEYVKISTDSARTWGKATRITRNRLNSWAPSVAISGEAVHLTWFDQKANGVGLPWRAPPIAPDQPHRQLEFDDAA